MRSIFLKMFCSIDILAGYSRDKFWILVGVFGATLPLFFIGYLSKSISVKLNGTSGIIMVSTLKLIYGSFTRALALHERAMGRSPSGNRVSAKKKASANGEKSDACDCSIDDDL